MTTVWTGRTVTCSCWASCANWRRTFGSARLICFSLSCFSFWQTYCNRTRCYRSRSGSHRYRSTDSGWWPDLWSSWCLLWVNSCLSFQWLLHLNFVCLTFLSHWTQVLRVADNCSHLLRLNSFLCFRFQPKICWSADYKPAGLRWPRFSDRLQDRPSDRFRNRPTWRPLLPRPRSASTSVPSAVRVARSSQSDSWCCRSGLWKGRLRNENKHEKKEN